jgi:hypothetical protein
MPRSSALIVLAFGILTPATAPASDRSHFTTFRQAESLPFWLMLPRTRADGGKTLDHIAIGALLCRHDWRF